MLHKINIFFLFFLTLISCKRLTYSDNRIEYNNLVNETSKTIDRYLANKYSKVKEEERIFYFLNDFEQILNSEVQTVQLEKMKNDFSHYNHLLSLWSGQQMSKTNNSKDVEKWFLNLRDKLNIKYKNLPNTTQYSLDYYHYIYNQNDVSPLVKRWVEAILFSPPMSPIITMNELKSNTFDELNSKYIKTLLFSEYIKILL